jgi:general stress protein 26
MDKNTKYNDTEKLFSLIKDVKFCMLTTADEDGTLRSRPMATQVSYEEKNLYFFTKKSSGKVDEIKEDSQINLAYANPSKQDYVSVSGQASLTQDKAKMEKFWNPAYKAWFPEGLEDPEISLLTVEIEKAEYWDSHSSAVVHLVGLVKAKLTGETYKPGEHGVVNSLN